MKDIETIFSDIPIPDKSSGKSNIRSRWGKFVDIKVGECVFVETRNDSNGLKMFLERRGMKVTTRILDGQIGVWRMPDAGSEDFE